MYFLSAKSAIICENLRETTIYFMKKVLFLSLISFLTFNACDNTTVEQENFNALKKEVLTHFTQNVAVATYTDLDEAAQTLNTTLLALHTSPTEPNLLAARTAWKNLRAIWEQSESFLIGPVDEKGYDPNMDTWPTDYVQMDSLLISSNSLSVSDLENITLSLRGYHPIEYILFGNHGDRTAASITDRQKAYMVSLSADLSTTCHNLHQDWIAAPVNYAQTFMTAGEGSTVYTQKQAAYLSLVEGLIGICEEVGEGKMQEPFDAQDPTIVESPYSGNSIADFKNNITGIRNVYMGNYKVAGKGIKDLVAAKNKALDNKIQAQITAAISSFDNITMYYEQAIIAPGQRVQAQQTMDALATLKITLEEELKPFVIQYITD